MWNILTDTQLLKAVFITKWSVDHYRLNLCKSTKIWLALHHIYFITALKITNLLLTVISLLLYFKTATFFVLNFAALNGVTGQVKQKDMQFWGQFLHSSETGRQNQVTNPTFLEDGYV
jgi:hypothetical protein